MTDPTNIPIPELSLVVLIGASGSGKSTFARRYFKATEVLSSDACRGMVCDDENDQAASKDAFEVLHFIAGKRLAAGRLTVVDATNVQPEARKPLVELARRYHVLPVAVVLDMPERLCRERNQGRPDRDFGDHVIRNHVRSLHQSLRGLEREGFRHVFTLDSPESADSARVTRVPLYNNRKFDHGPFDIIGDIHGCFDELVSLLSLLGYTVHTGGVETPPGRKAVFLGDLGDRGPNTPAVLRLVMGMTAVGTGLCVPGNHDARLLKKLSGRDIKPTYGLAETLEQLAAEPPEFIEQVRRFLDGLVSHYVLDDGRLVVAHAGMKEELQGRASGAVRSFAMFGETTGETDEFGLPIRYPWASDYRGAATVVYGHTPIPAPEWINRTINIDTGCVFGGSLTALRWPERDLVSVPAAQTYAEPARPFLTATGSGLSAQQEADDLLDIEDVLGKRAVETRLLGRVTIREENAAAALEVMSRFAANPKWLITLPPTMSPPETSRRPDLLEHPNEAFAYYRNVRVPRVICEEKHMGSRAIVVVCRDEGVAASRFGILDEGIGVCLTRTGRRFFDDSAMEQTLLSSIVSAATRAGLWEVLNTGWLCLDAELMPWSAKAQELLRQQYAAVGAAARATLPTAADLLDRTGAVDAGATALAERIRGRQKNAAGFVDAYRRYCWPVNSVSDLRVAPFHLLASEGAIHTDRDHGWHMSMLERLVAASDGLLVRTEHRIVDLQDAPVEGEGAISPESAVAWWEELTARGGEGMVVKPFGFTAGGPRGLIQPAVKCRGREYLRLIYGPDYTEPANLERLRSRGLSAKRTLALREFALGVEALERFVRLAPLRAVHECVFGILAMESEPIDPRL